MGKLTVPVYTYYTTADATLTAKSNDQTIVPDGGISVEGSGVNRSISFTPLKNGNIIITLTLNDGSKSVSTNFNVTVNEPVKVISVAPPGSGLYGAGQELDFTVNFDKVVAVTGTPSIPITLDTGGLVNALYAGGSGSTGLIFRYTVQAGHLDANGVSVGGSITLNDGTIKNETVDATLTLNNVGSTTAVLVDGVAPTVTSAILALSNAYLDITFSEGVYGATDGATALTMAKLPLTFTKNEGTATKVVISSVKKNNNEVEGSASVLTGGETTVRVFFTLTGIPNGLETIEVKPADGASIYDKAGNAMSAVQTTGAKTLNDKTPPALVSAVRTDDTHITVTLSKNCKNITGSNDGGFSVNETGAPGRTYTVSSIAPQGADASRVVLTVADLSVSAKEGVTVKYTAGGNGNVQDTLGNAMATDSAGVAAAAWDTTSPTVTSAILASSNAYLDITFSEGVYGATDGATALTTVKLPLTFTKNEGTADNVEISSVKKNDNEAEGSASVLTGGETTVRVFFTLTGIPNGLETIEVKPADDASIYDKAGNAMSAVQTTGAKTLNDKTPPTLVSAARTDDTHITVTLSKNCTNITRSDDGGFSVNETDLPGTTYAVSAIAPGTDASHVVLTVADLSVSAKEGVTVKYTAGGNGNVQDTLGNAMATDSAGVAAAAWDTTSPTVTSTILASSNAYLDITFSEGVYGATDGATALTTAKLPLTFTKNEGTADNVEISSLKKNDNEAEGSASVLTGGETTIRVFFTLTGIPNGLETIEVKPADDASIYDKAGNAMSAVQTTGAKTLNDKTPPTLVSAARTDDTHITVTLSKNCTNITGSNDGGFSVNETGAPGRTYTVSSIAPQGADASRVVLTVADLSVSAKEGVTVKYTAGGNGNVQDTLGNAMVTDSAGVTAAAWDINSPAITSTALDTGNAYLDITFSEGVYGSTDGATALTTAKLPLTFTKNEGTADNVEISSLKKNDNEAEGSASVLTGGETTIRVFFTLTGIPNGLETIEVKPADDASIYDKAGNAMSAVQTTGAKTLNDKTPPTLVSAARTDDTHITVTLSKNCTNITRSDDGGFSVNETDLPGTTYAVSAIAPGTDASHVVLTVADLSVSAKEGVTVKYTAGGNGNVQDTLGNAMVTDSAGVAAAAWDINTPAITSAALDTGNAYLDITFSEGVYGDSDGTTALTSSGLALTFTKNEGTATNTAIISVKNNDNVVEDSASILAGGETTVRVFFTLTGIPNGLETIEVKPADGASIYDKAGNAMSAAQTTGAQTLNDKTPPVLVGATRTDDTHITVTLSENCTNIAKSNDGGFTVTETGTPGTAYVVSAIAQGADARHVVLTVTSLSPAVKKGVIVKYTADGNGDVQDTAGNILATDRTGVAIAAWYIPPPPSPSLAVTTRGLPGAALGSPYSVALAASNGIPPYTWSATGLPQGLDITSGGVISGVPTAAGTFYVTVTVRDGGGNGASASFALVVNPATLAITTFSLPDGTVSKPYSTTLKAGGGTAPYTWSATGLPQGLDINTGGLISGVPAVAGIFNVTVTVFDGGGHSADLNLELPVNNLPVPITATTVIVDNTNKNLGVTSSTPSFVTVNIPGNVSGATINVGELLDTPVAGTVTTGALPALTVSATTSISAEPIVVNIPAGVKISAADVNWDGTIRVPRVQAKSSVIVTPDDGKTATVNDVIEIGFGDVHLTFSKAVRIVFPGRAGKDVGYYRDGNFVKITNVMSADNQAVGDALPPGGDGKIDVGPDLVVWTKHFTRYVLYTQTTAGPGRLQFSETAYSVSEDSGSATITITRTNGSDGMVMVHYTTSDGTATAGLDYTATSGDLTFENGETSKTISIPIISDSINEASETVNLVISNPTGGAILGGQSTAVLSIIDPVPAPPDDSQYTLWPGSIGNMGVAVDKAWQIKFNREIDGATITENSIFICRVGKGERHPVNIEISEAQGTTTVILRPTQPFIGGGSYELYVSRSVRDKGGEALAQAIRVPFTVWAFPPDISQYALWSGTAATVGVPVDKQWLVRFNHEVDVTTLTDTTIFICKAGTGERHPVAVGVADTPDSQYKTAQVRPVQPYSNGGSYVLYIDKSIKSKGGSYLNRGIQMPFSITDVTKFGPANFKETLFNGPAGKEAMNGGKNILSVDIE
ncbi:Calx-beta domain-containing protein [Desulfotomaculum sp. 1211_IL3151]|uniref:Calx-beta domain-containing protein n=1 Tax=Desulfotomaculum sp. 1211_IL3151 TaxID=3084055 RepID=UPI002FDB1D3E